MVEVVVVLVFSICHFMWVERCPELTPEFYLSKSMASSLLQPQGNLGREDMYFYIRILPGAAVQGTFGVSPAWDVVAAVVAAADIKQDYFKITMDELKLSFPYNTPLCSCSYEKQSQTNASAFRHVALESRTQTWDRLWPFFVTHDSTRTHVLTAFGLWGCS